MAMIHQEAAAVLGEGEPVAAGSSSVAPEGTDQLDMEAAEQLIQLSGGADDDAGSESRSADSVKCRRGNKDDKEAAVESRRRSADAGRSSVAAAGKDDGDGNGGEQDGKGAAESFACSTAAGVEEEKDQKAAAVESPPRRSADRPRPVGKDRRDGGIVYGEERKRPKFRSLAAIYKETETTMQVTPPAAKGEGDGDRDPSVGERRKKKTKRGAEVIPEDWYMHMHVN